MANTAVKNPDLENHLNAESPANTWILFAHRSEASLYASDGGVKNFRFLNRIPHPEGRLQNHEINTDREALGGVVNKGEAAFHETQIFARQLAEVLRKGRTQNQFTRLALFAEPRFLGEIRSSLDAQTASLISVAVDKEYRDAPDEALKEKVKPHFLGSTLTPVGH